MTKYEIDILTRYITAKSDFDLARARHKEELDIVKQTFKKPLKVVIDKKLIVIVPDAIYVKTIDEVIK